MFALIFRLRRLRLVIASAMFMQSVSSLKKDETGGRCQAWTLICCKKRSALAVKRHFPAVSFMHVRTKLANGSVRQDDESAGAANASIDIVKCVQRSIVQSNSSPKLRISGLSVRFFSVFE